MAAIPTNTTFYALKSALVDFDPMRASPLTRGLQALQQLPIDGRLLFSDNQVTTGPGPEARAGVPEVFLASLDDLRVMDNQFAHVGPLATPEEGVGLHVVALAPTVTVTGNRVSEGFSAQMFERMES